jgi:hypothetical protein
MFPVADEVDEVEPTSCAEAVSEAQHLLDRLVVRVDKREVLALDNDERTLSWATKIWFALRSLQSFAEWIDAEEFSGNFVQFCLEEFPNATTYYANKVSMVESERTDRDPACRSARTFSVPLNVNPDGRAYMPAHIKIDSSSVAPRIHFLDDTSRSGLVYVGYVGSHLPLAG